MKLTRRDCFAYKESNGIPYCKCLKNIKCEDCSFFKEKNKVKNNIFYIESFKNYDEYTKALSKYYMKYGNGHLEEFEEDNETE